MGTLLNRRRYMGGMNMDNYLIKTVTLAENHTSDSTGNPNYWANYMDLPLYSDNTDRNIYIVVFDGNTATQNYRVDFIMYYRDGSGNIQAFLVRNNRKTSFYSYSTQYSLYATQGTTVKVYKIPAT